MEKPVLNAELESKVHRGAKQERSSQIKSILNKSSQTQTLTSRVTSHNLTVSLITTTSRHISQF